MSCLRQFSDLESLFHNKKKAAGEEATYTAHLSQTFPHGLLPSSLEPGTTDQQYPLTTIIDTGASKVMINKSFATAMGLDLNNLNDGAKFVTASGAVKHPLGSTKAKVMFTLSCGMQMNARHPSMPPLLIALPTMLFSERNLSLPWEELMTRKYRWL